MGHVENQGLKEGGGGHTGEIVKSKVIFFLFFFYGKSKLESATAERCAAPVSVLPKSQRNLLTLPNPDPIPWGISPYKRSRTAYPPPDSKPPVPRPWG